MPNRQHQQTSVLFCLSVFCQEFEIKAQFVLALPDVEALRVERERLLVANGLKQPELFSVARRQRDLFTAAGEKE